MTDELELLLEEEEEREEQELLQLFPTGSRAGYVRRPGERMATSDSEEEQRETDLPERAGKKKRPEQGERAEPARTEEEQTAFFEAGERTGLAGIAKALWTKAARAVSTAAAVRAVSPGAAEKLVPPGGAERTDSSDLPELRSLGGAESGLTGPAAETASHEAAAGTVSYETAVGEGSLPALRREDAAGRFYRTLTRIERAAGYRRAEGRETVRVVGQGAEPPSLPDAAGLDRLLQRDARRYDGGFTWQ